ncbi:MAG: hypothetical protein K5905_26485 [Roseibium sp.]|uniref:hypothetical protein n=1 Tax=Roseibium sp. TaxID=1936156 RepID=UPI002609DF3C|nr:hypothetical protein [Roseibium sp.]MCV0429018.1 hypothetical protein [Roseibium sp.]
MGPEEEIFQYTSVEDPQWVDAYRDKVVCKVKFAHRNEAEDFVATPFGSMPHDSEIFFRCLAGEFGPITFASKERIDKLFRLDSGVDSFVVGDIASPSDDKQLQTYIQRFNRENRSGSETGCVIALGSIIDHLLIRLLDERGVKKRNFSQRIDATHELKIISDDEKAQLTLVREVRNAFGHEHAVSLRDASLKAKCDELYTTAIGDGASYSERLKFSFACAELIAIISSRLTT